MDNMTAPLDLDGLEKLSRAAKEADADPWYIPEVIESDGYSKEDAALFSALSPATVLALIARIRELATAYCEVREKLEIAEEALKELYIPGKPWTQNVIIEEALAAIRGQE